MKSTFAFQTTITAQTVLAGTLLRLPAAELDAAVQRELAENPALERADPGLAPQRIPVAHRGGAHDWAGAGQERLERLSHVPTPREQLINQARLDAPAAVLDIVCCLIDALDEHGLLRAAEDTLAAELGARGDQVRAGIAWLQQLDPPGIGARDLRECFLLQCTHLAASGVDCSHVVMILQAAWDSFKEQKWGSVARQAKISPREVESALQFMRDNLYPYPLSLLDGVSDCGAALGRPDLIVRRKIDCEQATFWVEVVAAGQHHLRIDEVHQLAARRPPAGVTPLAAEEREWVCQAVEQARRFIDAVEQRAATLGRIGQYVVEHQRDYFKYGPAQLKPLTRAAVAQALGLHESTVSRAVSDKVVQLPSGRLVDFSDLFDGSLAAKEAIRRLLHTAGPQLSDRQIAAQLEAQALCISRRTVAKYRAELGMGTMGRR
jgi:RNA polymerase sigma-54 factor